jgi:Tol biopolymer transport system component
MPDVREVFEMTVKQVEPDVDAWREQEQRQRRSSRNKKAGAFALVAAIGLAVAFVVADRSGPKGAVPLHQPSLTPAIAKPSVPSLVDLQTGDVTPLPDRIAMGSIYSISPDGTRLAYSECCGSPNRVFVANLDGSDVRRITPSGVDGFGAAWSPDGAKVVYQRRSGSTQEIGNLVVVDLGTGETTQITHLEPASYGLWFLDASFSPDGKRVYFQRPRGPNDELSTRWDLWSVPAEGGEATLELRDASMGVYSPDGQARAYIDHPRGAWGGARLLWGSLVDGSQRLLAEAVADGIDFPRWSPEGSRIAYSDGSTIRVLDVSADKAAGSTLVSLGSRAAWVGDHTLLIVPPGYG